MHGTQIKILLNFKIRIDVKFSEFLILTSLFSKYGSYTYF